MSTFSGGARYGRRLAALAGAAALIAAAGASPAWAGSGHGGHGHAGRTSTATPIKHLVVVYGENISFDHYFGTYPKAANTDGTPFTAAKNTPKRITTEANAGLLTKNPNLYAPQRLSPSEAVTCDQNHNYNPEQLAYDSGKADLFVQNTSRDTCSGGLYEAPGLAMDYYDGNTVTALWNYAQNYVLSDNSFDATYGPSTPGALNLVSGQTHGVVSDTGTGSTTDPVRTTTPVTSVVQSPNAQGVGTINGDTDPAYDDCSDKDHTSTSALAEMTGKNVGDLLNAKDVTWGWFEGGFTPSTPYAGAGTYAKCAGTTHANVLGEASEDYVPHHDPFQYYASTANPHHLAPTSLAEVGHNGQANHQYDMSYFDQAVAADDLPAVSFLKAPSYEDGHAASSDPIDEQNFLIKEINELQKSPEWSSTAVVLAYDDSDGWYDHVYHAPTNGSTDSTQDAAACQAGPSAAAGYLDRCGPGPRQPLLVISPYSRTNYIDDKFTTQASITAFIESNWRTGHIGAGSFDTTSGSLFSAFDFQHPNDKQVLLNANGSVASVRPITVFDNQDTVASLPLQNTASATSSSNSVELSGALGAAALAAIGTGYWVARRNRRRQVA
ncbi:alkaline phosphatase family protein [Streptacidiphilus sp. PB12-B1b]|uniref:phospholipase C n=1 Tax=Streptacidiphilus sp. PB12-B1b TaxID=2705012 RepID=UPI0015FA8A32|nr:alkaline phosphatase family protein [Streptacidiphilus sp. PB12-B1b]QMU75954.1 alkaline phosphatase family protein [Streptacidiphilus sp. PB12-B1b]